MKETLQFAIQLASQAQDMKPVARQVVDAIKLFGPEVAELLDGAHDLTLDVNSSIDRELRKYSNKKSA